LVLPSHEPAGAKDVLNLPLLALRGEASEAEGTLSLILR
jgi:hypothetical protein